MTGPTPAGQASDEHGDNPACDVELIEPKRGAQRTDHHERDAEDDKHPLEIGPLHRVGGARTYPGCDSAQQVQHDGRDVSDG